MAVEALKIIRAGEEEGREFLERAKANVAKILSDAEEEIKKLKEQAQGDKKSLAAEISANYAQDGKKDAEAIMKTAEEEASKLKAAAEANLESAVNVVLERVLGIR